MDRRDAVRTLTMHVRRSQLHSIGKYIQKCKNGHLLPTAQGAEVRSRMKAQMHDGTYLQCRLWVYTHHYENTIYSIHRQIYIRRKTNTNTWDPLTTNRCDTNNAGVTLTSSLGWLSICAQHRLACIAFGRALQIYKYKS